MRRTIRSLIAASVLAAASHVRADPESPWGVAPSAALSQRPAGWARSMADAGVTWVRGIHVGGGQRSIQPLTAAGMSLCGFLQWSPTRPATFPVDALSEFRAYVIEQVKRYRGSVTHWEVWNEPPNFSADKSPASYAQIVATAYDAAKSVDPNIQIGIAAKSTHLQFLAEAIRNGAKDKFDFVTLHPYETVIYLPVGWEGPYLGIVSNTRAMLREVNPNKAEAPIWFTEVGVEATTRGEQPISEEAQADSLIKIYAMGIAQGVARIHWFDPQDSEGLHFGLLRDDGTAKPAYQALRELTQALGAKPKFLGYVPLADNAYSLLFEGPSHDVLAAWGKPELCQTVTFPDAIDAIDPGRGTRQTCQTVNLTDRPQLLQALRGSKTSNAWRRARTQNRPLWDTGSERDSAVYRAGVPALGVHAIGPLEETCEDGRCELDLRKRSVLRFGVDPQLQGYKSHPVEVVLTLRPHNNPRAGFNFRYEVAGIDADDYGMVRIGRWNPVRGTEPITLRWKLPNPSFVAKYGASLAIDCDQVEHCDFGVLSLIVNKR
jgi:hypothetical protein